MLPAESTRVIASRDDRNSCPAKRFHSSTAFLCSSEVKAPDELGSSNTEDALIWASGGIADEQYQISSAQFSCQFPRSFEAIVPSASSIRPPIALNRRSAEAYP